MNAQLDAIVTVEVTAPVFHVPPTVVEKLDDTERTALRAEITALLKRENAVLVAHYYTDPELQSLAVCRKSTLPGWRAGN